MSPEVKTYVMRQYTIIGKKKLGKKMKRKKVGPAVDIGSIAALIVATQGELPSASQPCVRPYVHHIVTVVALALIMF